METNQGRITTPDLARTRTRSELEDKKNKHKKNSEVAEPGSKKTNLTPLKLQEKKKMTYSTKVKTASTQKRQTLDKKMPQSPSLKRLKTPK